jgi:MinD-like ATPase involved in chromosome partitioning or flagellar assembly
LGTRLSRIRTWLDGTPLASIGLALMREATGRAEPLEAIRPTRPQRFRDDARIGFWSLAAGVGSSTTAALVAQRAAAAGQAPLLVDLDRWAPSLALRAAIESATVVDALVQPDRERDLVARWASVPFLAGSPQLHRDFDPDRVGALLARLSSGRGMVVDLGAGADALDAKVIAHLTRLCVVSGGRAAQLQALFCARYLLRSATCPVGLVVVGVDERDATLIAARAQLPLLGAIPDDPYLARDDFAARAPTMRAIDKLIGGL